MFGKAEWFRARRRGWGLVPIAWQGWGYAAGWTAAISLPFALLVERHQAVEALIWGVAAMLLLVGDVHEILRASRRDSASDVLYIGDDESEIEHQTATRKFRLRWWA